MNYQAEQNERKTKRLAMLLTFSLFAVLVLTVAVTSLQPASGKKSNSIVAQKEVANKKPVP